MADAPSGELEGKDVKNSVETLGDIQLTPSSSKVLSQEDPINIDSTSWKDKCSKSNVDNIPKLTYMSAEQRLDNIDAALEIVENLKKNESNNAVKCRLSLTEKSITNVDGSSNCEMIEDQSNEISLEDTSSDRIQVVDATTLDSTKSITSNDGNLQLYKCSIMPTTERSNLKPCIENTESSSCMVPVVAEESKSSEVKDRIGRDTSEDTAFITTHSNLYDNDVTYNFVISNDTVKNYIINGNFIDFTDNIVDPYDPKEVKKIMDDVIIFGVHFYLVRWKNWSSGYMDTWEQFKVLYVCQDFVYNYHREKHRKKKVECIDTKKEINGLHLMLSKKIISKLFDVYRSETGLCLPIINTDDLIELLNGINIENKQIQYNRVETLKMSLATVALGFFRRRQFCLLNDYASDINILTNGNYNIKVENNIDLEGPPELMFTYAPQCILENICRSGDSPIGCNCKNICKSGCCCIRMAENSAIYDTNKCVIVPPTWPIFECNRYCQCPSECINRVVQLGSQVNVCIYKTSSYNWGVKAKQDIKKGQFVSEITGEVVTVKEGQQRLKIKYSSPDHMWTMDFNDKNNYKYIIDNSHYANLTYFINHSCNANLNLYSVWIDCLDLNLPHLALFASRDIMAGEHLTTNYFSQCDAENLKKTSIKCPCKMDVM